jgi:hypothetical protein
VTKGVQGAAGREEARLVAESHLTPPYKSTAYTIGRGERQERMRPWRQCCVLRVESLGLVRV